MATQTTPKDDAGFQGKVGLEAQGLNPKGCLIVNGTAG